MSTPARRSIDCLDAFRGIAVLMVVVFHYGGDVLNQAAFDTWENDWRTFHPTPSNLVNRFLFPVTWGWAGVSLFFVLSGFLIHLTTPPGTPWPRYARRRFWRIYPPYVVALSVFVVVGGLVYDGTVAIPWWQVVTHLALVHNFSGDTFFGICPAFWSLALECQFYLAYPLVRFAFLRVGPGWTLAAIAALSMVTRGYLLATGAVEESDGHLTHSFATLWVDWVLGAYLADRYARGVRVFARPGAATAGVTTVFVLSTLYRPASLFSFSVASLLAAVLVDWRLHANPGAGVRRVERWFGFFGLISYSMYLYHQPLLDYLLTGWRWLVPSRPPLGFVAAALFPVVFAVVVAVSFAAYRLIEAPSNRVGRRERRPPTAE